MTAAGKFPALPTFGAHTRVVFWEPIYGSGERLAVIVAAKSEDGFKVQPVVGKATWQCFLGNQAKTAMRVVEMAVASLEAHLNNGQRIESWTPPLSGMIAGDVRFIVARDMTQVIRIVMRESASFAVLPQALDFNDDLMENSDESDVDRWPVQVSKLVIDRRPRLAQFFNRKLSVNDHARLTHLDYAGERYCANFAKMLPDIRLGHWVGKAKIKLLDLEQIRGHAANGTLFKSDADMQPQFEMILYRPRADDPGYTDKAMGNLEKAIAQLEDFADGHQMRLIIAHEATEAANRLLEKEAA